MKFILATKNLKKLKELERILVPLGHEVVCERDLENPASLFLECLKEILSQRNEVNSLFN